MIEWLLLAVLIVLSIVDVIWKRFPSGFLTGLLFLVAIVAYVIQGETALALGLFSFIIGWMFLEFGVPINGVADLKVITMIGFLLLDLRFFFLFISMVMVIGFIYQIIIMKMFSLKEDQDVAFIPVITLCYITVLILGGVI